MTDNSSSPPFRERARRPIPKRTTPHRNILGVFWQSDGAVQSAPSHASGTYGQAVGNGHPLGLPADMPEDPSDRIAANINHEYMQSASNVIDRPRIARMSLSDFVTLCESLRPHSARYP